MIPSCKKPINVDIPEIPEDKKELVEELLSK